MLYRVKKTKVEEGVIKILANKKRKKKKRNSTFFCLAINIILVEIVQRGEAYTFSIVALKERFLKRNFGTVPRMRTWMDRDT